MAASESPNYPNEPEQPPQMANAAGRTSDKSPRQNSTRSQRPWWIALGIVFLLVGGGLGWRWWQSNQAQTAADPAAAQAQSVPVRLENVQTSTIEDSDSFVGNLESRESVTLRPEIEGRVSQIYVRSGDRVEAGTPLIQLSPDKREAELASVLASVNSARALRANAASELQALEAERAAAVAEVELQEEEFQRYQSLVEAGALPRQELDRVTRDRAAAIAQLNAIKQRIEAARSSLAEAEAGLQQAQANANLASAQLEDATIVAPFAGIVGDIPVRIGSFVGTSDELTSVTTSQSLDLRLSIPIERRRDLRQGLRVELSDARGNPLRTGQISFISPQVTANAQSILAKATFPNPDGQLLDQQFVRARVIWSEGSGVVVPASAVSRLGGQTFVFVAEPQEASGQPQEPAGQTQLIARQRPVQLGELQGNNYQVIEGLEPGETIVVSGILNVRDGVPITAERQPPQQSKQPS
ncbi:efflux RND transporter periplasmic adaptor subunit [Pleurocapsales cyanobacterium LEGE 06147]|nr:efflux RND transporter periplasmic adaptor subunit [Pleurocapsales cyanobacterium LEGE 06147]